MRIFPDWGPLGPGPTGTSSGSLAACSIRKSPTTIACDLCCSLFFRWSQHILARSIKNGENTTPEMRFGVRTYSVIFLEPWLN
ncbi:hypothetical protein XELAEV_18030700mg [Xenopus laevis]|uniref:Uncharacterized protein n=1 Tax=Xenopus laevis TaxID=8355 RepID=A0A974CLE3_XENLA|nr:hypothetical protein XELAEV_18030700mg [Xenopus laevis]